jgi:hypothetical protein
MAKVLRCDAMLLGRGHVMGVPSTSGLTPSLQT